MASPAQADIVRELYGRRDTLPEDKRAVVEELYGRMNQEQPSPLSTTEKARNFLMTGKTSGPGHYDLPTEKDQFNFPPALNTAANVAAGVEGATALVKAAPLVAQGAKAAAAGIKGALTPKASSMFGRGAAAARDVVEATRMQDPLYARLAQTAESPLAGGIKKQALKFTPSKSSSSISRAPKVTKGPSGDMPTGTEADFAPVSDLPAKVQDAVAEGAKKKAAGIGYTPPPDAPVAAPGRVRATPEAQTRADEIASLTRHAQTIPLAEQTIQQGVSSKDLLALPDEARVAYMKKLGLKSTSPDTWRAYVGHVLRLERVKK